MTKFIKNFLFVLCFLLSSTFCFAQDNQGGGDPFQQSTGDMFVVLGSALGGAILGLSTLSFVEIPGDHLKNIVVGGAIGTIIGVGVVAFQQAGKSQSYYEDSTGAQTSVDFSTIDRIAWHQRSFIKNNRTNIEELPYINYSFKF